MQNVRALFQSRRFWGLTGTALVLALLLKIFAGLDVSWIMPPTNQIAQAIIDVWPQMPFFVNKEPTASGGEVIYYTVPTRQMTPQELARMGVTNRLEHPAAPR